MTSKPPFKSGGPNALASAQTVPEGGPFEPERSIGADELPIRLGRFLLVEELGRGGMGVVFRAVDEDLQREVALKRLHAGLFRQSAIQRFLEEARAQAGLRHPNLCEVYAIDTIDGAPFFVMRLVRGHSLEQHLERGHLPPRLAAEFARDLGQALCCAHSAALLHRDVKPANILLEPQLGGGFRPVLIDFGLVKRVDGESLPIPGDNVIAGTPP